jgi:hypothetical protein
VLKPVISFKNVCATDFASWRTTGWGPLDASAPQGHRVGVTAPLVGAVFPGELLRFLAYGSFVPSILSLSTESAPAVA